MTSHGIEAGRDLHRGACQIGVVVVAHVDQGVDAHRSVALRVGDRLRPEPVDVVGSHEHAPVGSDGEAGHGIGDDAQVGTGRVELLDAVVAHVDVPGPVERQVARMVELAGARPGRAPRPHEGARRVEDLDAVVAVVGDRDVALGIDRYSKRAVELAVTVARGPERSDEGAVRVELLDAVRGQVADVDVPRRTAHGHVVRGDELSVPGPGGAPLGLVVAVGVETDDTRVRAVDYVDVPCRRHRDPGGRGEMPGPGAVAPRQVERPCRTEALDLPELVVDRVEAAVRAHVHVRQRGQLTRAKDAVRAVEAARDQVRRGGGRRIGGPADGRDQ